MAIPASMQWRIRASGNNANGGGFDATVSGVLATTLNGAIASGATTVVVASATGWPGSGNYYARIGNLGPETFSSGGTGSSEIVLVTAGQGTTSWTVTRGQLGTTAQAFATGIVVDNDLSRCNTAPLSGSAGASTNSTTFTDATATFDLTCVGNVIFIASGTGATVGPYIIQSRTNATTVVLDRVSGTYTAGVWKMGGAWADPRTNCENGTYVKAGNTTFVRAGGSGSVASPDYTVPTSLIACTQGNTTDGLNHWVGENGRPYVKSNSGNCLIFYQAEGNYIENFYLIANSTTNGSIGIVGGTNNSPGSGMTLVNVILDQNGLDVNGIRLAGTVMVGCEVLSSTANGGAAGSGFGVSCPAYGYANHIIGCNIHDCWGHGGEIRNGTAYAGCIIAKNKGNGLVTTNDNQTGMMSSLTNNTIDGNSGHGVSVVDAPMLQRLVMVGNIISNHNQASKYGIHANFGSTAVNDRTRGFFDNNTFYNNTSDALNLTISSTNLNGHVYANNIGVDPGFVGQSTENYAISTALQNLGFPQTAFPQSKSGQTTGVRNYQDPGAVQPAPSAGGISPVILNPRPSPHIRR